MKTNSTQKRNKSFSFILEILIFFWASVSSNLTLFWTVHFSFCNETVIIKSLFWLETSKMHENESFMQAKKVSEYAFVAELLKINVEKIDSFKVYHAFKISPCYASFSSLDLCYTAVLQLEMALFLTIKSYSQLFQLEIALFGYKIALKIGNHSQLSQNFDILIKSTSMFCFWSNSSL